MAAGALAEKRRPGRRRRALEIVPVGEQALDEEFEADALLGREAETLEPLCIARQCGEFARVPSRNVHGQPLLPRIASQLGREAVIALGGIVVNPVVRGLEWLVMLGRRCSPRPQREQRRPSRRARRHP